MRLSFKSVPTPLGVAAFVIVASAAWGSPSAAGPEDPGAGAPSSTSPVTVTGSTAMASAAAAAAQDPAAAPASADDGFLGFFRGVELSGFVDGYYTYNFNEPKTGGLTLLRNFDSEHNQFTLALAEVALGKVPTSDDRVGFRIDLDYGPVAGTVNSFEPGDKGVLENLQQAYVSYMASVGTGLTLDFGKFVTPIGAEVIESKDNWNYSRSLLFALAIPYYHMGARVTYAPSDKVSLGGTLTNGWNDVRDNNSAKTFGVSATLKPGDFTIIQNYMAGPEQPDNTDDWRHLYDLTVTWAASPAFSIMGNYDYGRDEVTGDSVNWQGVALYAKAQLSDSFALVPRFEIYDDPDGFTTTASQNVKEFTITAETKGPKGPVLRCEYRRDWSDQEFFIRDGRLVKDQNTFTVGLVYGFSTKAP